MATTLSPEDAAQLRNYERDRFAAMAEGYIDFFAPVTALAITPLLDAVRLKPGMKLLDLPAGAGALAGEATRRGAQVTGIDLAPGMIARARERHPGIDFRVGDVDHLPVADGVTPVGMLSLRDFFVVSGAILRAQGADAASSLLRASTQRAPSGVCSFFQNGAWVFR